MQPANTLLLTIDFINDIVHPSGKLASCAQTVAKNNVISRTNDAVAHARQQGMRVAHVKVGFPATYANLPANSPVFSAARASGALQLGAWGTEFHETLRVAPEDFILVKPRISAFYGTALETILRSGDIETIVITGVSTNMAVELTAREAHDRDYQPIVLADCCAATTDEIHQAALAGALTRIARVTTSGAWMNH